MARKPTAEQQIHALTNAVLMCRSHGHSWDEVPTASGINYNPRYEYIHGLRVDYRCTRSCGVVKVVVYDYKGAVIYQYTKYPPQYRIVNLGRGTGRAPFIAEWLARKAKKGILKPDNVHPIAGRSRRKAS